MLTVPPRRRFAGGEITLAFSRISCSISRLFIRAAERDRVAHDAAWHAAPAAATSEAASVPKMHAGALHSGRYGARRAAYHGDRWWQQDAER